MEEEDQKCFVCGHESSKHRTVRNGDLDDDECPGIYTLRELRQHIFILVLRAGIFGFFLVGVLLSSFVGGTEGGKIYWGPAFVAFGLILWREYRDLEARHQVSKEKNISGLYIAWLIAAVMLVFAAVGKYP